MQKKLEPRDVAKLKPKAKDYDVWDLKPAGFGVHVFPTGTKSWTFRYRNASGRQRRMKLGTVGPLTLADARAAARAARREVELGRDPQAAKVEKRTADTVGTFAITYMNQWAKARKKSWKHDQAMLDADVLPAWQHHAMKDITKRHGRDLLQAIVDRGAAIHANRVLSLLKKMWRFAAEQEVIDIDVMRDIRKPTPERIRQRSLTPDEIRIFWAAVEAMPEKIISTLWKVRLLTGQRPQEEVAQMRWADVDLDSGWWTLTDPKNGIRHRVPLSAPVLVLLKEIRPTEEVTPRYRPFVFAHCTRDPLVRTGTHFKQLDDFQPRDLRKTFRTLAVADGVPSEWLERVMNHKLKGMDAVYDLHKYNAEKKKALDHWARRIDQIVNEPDGAAVLPFVVRA